MMQSACSWLVLGRGLRIKTAERICKVVREKARIQKRKQMDEISKGRSLKHAHMHHFWQLPYLIWQTPFKYNERFADTLTVSEGLAVIFSLQSTPVTMQVGEGQQVQIVQAQPQGQTQAAQSGSGQTMQVMQQIITNTGEIQQIPVRDLQPCELSALSPCSLQAALKEFPSSF